MMNNELTRGTQCVHSDNYVSLPRGRRRWQGRMRQNPDDGARPQMNPIARPIAATVSHRKIETTATTFAIAEGTRVDSRIANG